MQDYNVKFYLKIILPNFINYFISIYKQLSSLYDYIVNLQQ